MWDELLRSQRIVHPLQSWEWGEAKRSLGEQVNRTIVSKDGIPILLAQSFVKSLRPFGRAAWIPNGPVNALRESLLTPEAVTRLAYNYSRRGIFHVLAQRYDPASDRVGVTLPFTKLRKTFVVQIHSGIAEIEKEFRWGSKRFARLNGVVGESLDERDLLALEAMCSLLARRKNFRAYGTEGLMRAAWRTYRVHSEPFFRLRLFTAVVEGEIAAAALVIHSSKSAHYIWGAFDYARRKTCANDALHWHIVDRLHAEGVELYDLEGADQKGNPGVYSFKKRMGGTLIELPRPEYRLAPFIRPAV